MPINLIVIHLDLDSNKESTLNFTPFLKIFQNFSMPPKCPPFVFLILWNKLYYQKAQSPSITIFGIV